MEEGRIVGRDCGKHWLKEMRCESWRRRRAGSIGQRLKRTESLGNPTRRFWKLWIRRRSLF